VGLVHFDLTRLHLPVAGIVGGDLGLDQCTILSSLQFIQLAVVQVGTHQCFMFPGAELVCPSLAAGMDEVVAVGNLP
jgi:hypothetical protein